MPVIYIDQDGFAILEEMRLQLVEEGVIYKPSYGDAARRLKQNQKKKED